MEFECINENCKKIFRPHRFIGLRHPGNAICPKCGTKGKLTEKGRENRKEIFFAINQANKAAERP